MGQAEELRKRRAALPYGVYHAAVIALLSDAIAALAAAEARVAELQPLWDRLCPDHHAAVCEGGLIDGSEGCPYCHVAQLQQEVAELEALFARPRVFAVDGDLLRNALREAHEYIAVQADDADACELAQRLDAVLRRIERWAHPDVELPADAAQEGAGGE